MKNIRKISVEFENKKYPLFIKDSNEEEEYYRNARKKLRAKVAKYRSRFSKVEGLYTQDFYIMAGFQFALDGLLNDSFVEKISQLSEEIDKFLEKE
ncbi:MAG: cell division protein ZapA [Candidatus Azobacteroides sp.]|nr:cell division protein ZapA [Candidatus Azobacteroides sp.]